MFDHHTTTPQEIADRYDATLDTAAADVQGYGRLPESSTE